MSTLHSNKITAEKDAFFGELFSGLPQTKRVLAGGEWSAKARRLHERFLAIHILAHYRPSPDPLRTEYFDVILSHLIECEGLFALGFYNAGMMSLRAAIESAMKLLYYENHPIEWELHEAGKHDLSGLEYRTFLYLTPRLSELPFHQKNVMESLWTDLCKFVHCDLKAVARVGSVAELRSAIGFAEPQFAGLLSRLQGVNKVVVACCFAVNPKWLLGVEKAYFDAVLDVYTVVERRLVKQGLRIA